MRARALVPWLIWKRSRAKASRNALCGTLQVQCKYSHGRFGATTPDCDANWGLLIPMSCNLLVCNRRDRVWPTTADIVRGGLASRSVQYSLRIKSPRHSPLVSTALLQTLVLSQ